MTMIVGIAVAPRAIEKLEDWVAERRERRRLRSEARAAEREGAHLVVIKSAAEVMRVRANRREDGVEGDAGGGLRHRHRVSTALNLGTGGSLEGLSKSALKVGGGRPS